MRVTPNRIGTLLLLSFAALLGVRSPSVSETAINPFLKINYSAWQRLEGKQQYRVVSAFIDELNPKIEPYNRSLVQSGSKTTVPPGKLDDIPAIMVFMECLIDLGFAKPK